MMTVRSKDKFREAKISWRIPAKLIEPTPRVDRWREDFTFSQKFLPAIAIPIKMSDSGGLTLRKKGGRRQTVQQISGPIPPKLAPSKPGKSIATLRDRTQQSAATSDLVKRRYSARFNQLPDFTNAPPVPSLPGQPGAPKRWSRPRSGGRPRTSESALPIQVDIGALRDPQLQPEDCR